MICTGSFVFDAHIDWARGVVLARIELTFEHAIRQHLGAQAQIRATGLFNQSEGVIDAHTLDGGLDRGPVRGNVIGRQFDKLRCELGAGRELSVAVWQANGEVEVHFALS